MATYKKILDFDNKDKENWGIINKVYLIAYQFKIQLKN